MAGAPQGGESLPKQSLTPLGLIGDVGLVEGLGLSLGIEFRPGFGEWFVRWWNVPAWGCRLDGHVGRLEFGGQLMGPPRGRPAVEVTGGALGAFEGLDETAFGIPALLVAMTSAVTSAHTDPLRASAPALERRWGAWWGGLEPCNGEPPGDRIERCVLYVKE